MLELNPQKQHLVDIIRGGNYLSNLISDRRELIQGHPARFWTDENHPAAGLHRGHKLWRIAKHHTLDEKQNKTTGLKAKNSSGLTRARPHYTATTPEAANPRAEIGQAGAQANHHRSKQSHLGRCRTPDIAEDIWRALAQVPPGRSAKTRSRGDGLRSGPSVAGYLLSTEALRRGQGLGMKNHSGKAGRRE